MADAARPSLTPAEQTARRDWFRRHWETGIPFNGLCGISVRAWGPDGVELVAAYDDTRSAHPGILHGGLTATLVDTAATAAVLAGHDFERGSRISTSAMSVQYLGLARGEDLVARAHAVARGRLVHTAAVEVVGAVSGTTIATGQVTAVVSGERPGLLGPPPGDGDRAAATP